MWIVNGRLVNIAWMVVFTTLLALCSLILALDSPVVPVAAANLGYLGTRTVDIDHFITNFDAVRITKVTVAGQEIHVGLSTGAREDERGTPFQADEDWLKNMIISVKNRTEKVIVCVQIALWFPDIGDGSSPARPATAYTITVGQRPDWSLHYRDGSRIPPEPTKKELSFAPGQTIVIPVADYIDAIQSTVEEKIPFSQVTRVNISRANAYLADGTRWDGAYAAYYVPDPDHPEHDTKLGPTYFPGKSSQN